MTLQQFHVPTIRASLTLAAAGIALTLAACSSSNGPDLSDEPPLASLPDPRDREEATPDEDFLDPFAAEADDAAFAGPRIAAVNDRSPRANFGQLSVYGSVGNTPSSRRPYDGSENLMQVSHGVEGADFDPDISHQGDRIVFASTQHRRTADVYIKRIGSRSVTQLTADPANDVMPAISPDDSRIAFASDRAGSWNLYVMNATGGQSVQLTDDSAHELHPSWSPDGANIAYCRLGEVSGRWELWVLEVDNPAVKHFVGYGLFPVWSPAGDEILFQRARDRGDRLFSVWTIDFENGQGENPTEVIASSAAAIVNPTWSPDGRRIAFCTIPIPDHVDSDRPSVADLWIMNADGTGRANLTGGRFVNLMPAWARDNRIYFISDRSGRDSLWSVLPEKAIVAAGGRPDSNLATVPDDDQ